MEELEYLSLKDCTGPTAFPVRLCAFVRLCHFYCDNIGRTDDCLHALAQSCPSLRSLHYGHAAELSTAGLEAVLLACQELHTVGFTSSYGFTNAHVATVAQHRRKLTALRVVFREDGINEECVTVLAPRLPELHNLHLINLRCTSDAPIALLTQHCGKLTDLALNNLHGNVTERALVALCGALTSLQDLGWSQTDCMSDLILAAIGKNCHCLRTLDLCGTFNYLFIAVTAIAQGCTALESLSFTPDGKGGRDSLFGDLGLSVWKVLRPKLKFWTEERPWTRWDDFRRDV
jgi:hypothetical protein